MTPALLAKRKPATMPDLRDYMTTEEAAKELGFHVVTIRKMVIGGKLKSLKVGVSTMILRESVTQYKKQTAGMSKHDPRRRKKQGPE